MHMSPDVAIRTVFGWTDDDVEARSLAETFDQVRGGWEWRVSGSMVEYGRV